MSDTKDCYSDEARESAILLAEERLRKYNHEIDTGQYLAESGSVDCEGVEMARIILANAYLAEHQADGKETLADMIDKDEIDLSQQEVIDSTAGMRYRNAKLYYTEWAERTEKTS
jgi:hypothetical protein